jgi:hypothetical protein
MINKHNDHVWKAVRFIPPSGRANAYNGHKCICCGVRRYPFGNVTRWKYPDGRVHDSTTVSETACMG